MSRGPSYPLALALVLITALPSAAAGSTKVSGSSRSFALYSDDPQTDTQSAMFETRLRLKLSAEPAAKLHSELAYELAPFWRDKTTPASTSRTYQGFSYRAGDLENTLYPAAPDSSDSFVVSQNLDRAFISYRATTFDLLAGRQPVAFGSARAANPTDVLAPYPYNTIAKEERIGVDAIRLRAPLGELSELDLGAIFGDDFREDKSAAYLRLKGYSLGTDFSVMAMRFREHILYGLDLARAIGGAGTWLEAAQVFTSNPDDDYLSLSAGAEYLLAEDLYASLEYHHNGAGTTNRREYLTNSLRTAYIDGGVYLLARDYLIPGLSYQATPLLSLSLSIIYNTNDRSTLLSPSLEYNVAVDLYLGLGGFAGTGGKSGQPGESSEFSNYPDLWYASLSYYF
ncbi:MAG: hypothetical protein KKG47_02515 [Proteobacteria bacterium]|nr:hypothetical protein [Pseudomonadota bacterium]MBU1738035.1 hypothetical protein [Pseudomonadota bacterium]